MTDATTPTTAVQDILERIQRLAPEEQAQLLQRLPTQIQTITITTPPTHADDAHAAFGLWINRTEIQDAAVFAAQLRRRVEGRHDGRTNTTD